MDVRTERRSQGIGLLDDAQHRLERAEERQVAGLADGVERSSRDRAALGDLRRVERGHGHSVADPLPRAHVGREPGDAIGGVDGEPGALLGRDPEDELALVGPPGELLGLVEVDPQCPGHRREAQQVGDLVHRGVVADEPQQGERGTEAVAQPIGSDLDQLVGQARTALGVPRLIRPVPLEGGGEARRARAHHEDLVRLDALGDHLEEGGAQLLDLPAVAAAAEQPDRPILVGRIQALSVSQMALEAAEPARRLRRPAVQECVLGVEGEPEHRRLVCVAPPR